MPIVPVAIVCCAKRQKHKAVVANAYASSAFCPVSTKASSAIPGQTAKMHWKMKMTIWEEFCGTKRREKMKKTIEIYWYIAASGRLSDCDTTATAYVALFADICLSLMRMWRRGDPATNSIVFICWVRHRLVKCVSINWWMREMPGLMCCAVQRVGRLNIVLILLISTYLCLQLSLIAYLSITSNHDQYTAHLIFHLASRRHHRSCHFNRQSMIDCKPSQMRSLLNEIGMMRMTR